MGKLSDKYGRRLMILICMYMGVVGSLVKWFLRFNFWGFCAANFFNGLFAGSVPVAMAYASDVFSKRSQKDSEQASIAAINFLGSTGGGIIAIVMQSVGLFEPLFVGAALSLVAGLVCQLLLIEPSKHLFKKGDGHREEEDDSSAPKTVDYKVLTNILVGATVDYFGSTGQVPIGLSPLMFNAFYADLEAAGKKPVMSPETYQWTYVMLLVMVFPGSLLSSICFAKFGTAKSAVAANLLTAGTVLAQLHIALATPSTATLAVFIAVVYLAYPLSIISQLSTGPMLDRIAPADKKGLLQGTNTLIGNLVIGMGPFVYGLLSDAIGIQATLYISTGISILAAAINYPLTFHKEFGPLDINELLPKGLMDDVKKFMENFQGEIDETEYQDEIEKASRGEWVSAPTLQMINKSRILRGEQPVVAHYGKYDKDAPYLEKKTKEEVLADYMCTRFSLEHAAERAKTIGPDAMMEDFKLFHSISSEEKETVKQELGDWFTDYLLDNGYHMQVPPQLMKYAIRSAFPPIYKGGLQNMQPEDLEEHPLNLMRVLNHFKILEEADVGIKQSKLISQKHAAL